VTVVYARSWSRVVVDLGAYAASAEHGWHELVPVGLVADLGHLAVPDDRTRRDCPHWPDHWAAVGGRVSEALTAATAPRILAAVATKARHRANHQGMAASDYK
jgi:hypothetical protein